MMEGLSDFITTIQRDSWDQMGSRRLQVSIAYPAPTRRDWGGCCTGCWGGQLRYDPGSATDRGWGGCAPQTETLDRWPPAPLRVGSPICADIMSAPFPIGVLEARSKELARAVAGCATADLSLIHI